MTEREGFDGLDLDGKKSIVALRTANGIRKLHSLPTEPDAEVIAGESMACHYGVATIRIWQFAAAVCNWPVRKKVRFLKKHP